MKAARLNPRSPLESDVEPLLRLLAEPEVARWWGKGLGPEAIRALTEHLFRDRGHHRIAIDPAADDARAIRAYEKVGFQRVGVMRQYERGPEGTWHDGVLMELLASDSH